MDDPPWRRAGVPPKGVAPGLLWLAVAGWALLLAQRVEVPSPDGIGYLWMAERFAAGAPGAALAMVFPPGWPLAAAPLLALGLPAEAAMTWVAAAALGGAAVAVRRCAELVQPGAGWSAATLFAAGPLLPRLPGELFSEPLFLLVVGWGTWWGMTGRAWRCGSAAGLAYWIRPEGALLAVAFAAHRPRHCLRLLVPTVLAVVALPGWRAACGLDWELLPLLAFHDQRDDLPERGQWLANLAAVPWGLAEAFGPLAGLGLAWLVPDLRRRATNPAALRPLVWMTLGQFAAIGAFVMRRRFLVSAAVPIALLATVPLATMSRRIRLPLVGAAAAVAAGLAWSAAPPPSRGVERELGRFLGAMLPGNAAVVSDLPRVVYYAGRQPPPPRHFTAAQLAAQAAAPGVQAVVLAAQSQRESSRAAAELLAETFAPLPLPEPLASRCRARGLLVLSRR